MKKLIRFEKSKNKFKKYDAVILDNGIEKKISFGDIRYEHYRDSTGLNLYSHLDHNDEKRRINFHKRHFKNEPFTASYFSKKYLW